VIAYNVITEVETIPLPPADSLGAAASMPNAEIILPFDGFGVFCISPTLPFS
jgi:hypothetical protein